MSSTQKTYTGENHSVVVSSDNTDIRERTGDAKAEKKSNAKQVRRVVLLDYDGCLKACIAGSDGTKMCTSLAIIRYLYELSQQADLPITIMIGSARSSLILEDINGYLNQNGCCAREIIDLCQMLNNKYPGKFVFDGFLLGDIFYKYKDGHMCARICKEFNIEEGAKYFAAEEKREIPTVNPDFDWDLSKFAMIYAAVHRQTLNYQGEEIVCHLIDDDAQILKKLKEAYNKYPSLMPVQARLQLWCHQPHEDSFGVNQSAEEIKGSGQQDHDYRNTIIRLTACARKYSPQVKYLSLSGFYLNNPQKLQEALASHPQQNSSTASCSASALLTSEARSSFFSSATSATLTNVGSAQEVKQSLSAVSPMKIET